MMTTRAARVFQRQDDSRLAAAGWAAVAAMALGGITWWLGVPEQHGYVWHDVAVVHLIAALPLAVAVCRGIVRQQVSRDVLGAGALGLVVVGWFTGLQPLEQAVLRLAAALSIAVGLVWLWSAHLGHPPRRSAEPLPEHPQMLAVVGGVVLAVVPWIYIQARCRHDVDQVAQLMEQSRIGEAYELSSRILRLAPTIQCNGRSLSDVQRELAAVVEQVQRRVAQPLPADVGDEQWLARVRELAILGQSAAALKLMAADPLRAGLPEACNLRGTLLETLHRWQPAGEAYAAAKAAWEARSPSLQRQAGLVQALTGIAYAERKQGRYAAAEVAYQQRLTLAPTADSHFLLAQFYDDTQRSALARSHARQAMTLAPEQYQRSGEQLLKKLATFHFGCFQD